MSYVRFSALLHITEVELMRLEFFEIARQFFPAISKEESDFYFNKLLVEIRRRHHN